MNRTSAATPTEPLRQQAVIHLLGSAGLLMGAMLQQSLAASRRRARGV